MHRYIILLLFGLVWGVGTLAAQDDYDPANPPEPYERQRVLISVEPSAAGYVSFSGTGTKNATGNYTCTAGTVVTLKTSAKADYVFTHWTLNGEEFDGNTATTLSYVVPSMTSNLVAHYVYYTDAPGYVYNPTSPKEPTTPTSPPRRTH